MIPQLGLGLALLASCGPDPEMVREKEQLDLRVADLQKQNLRLEKENDALHARIGKLKSEMERLDVQKILDRLGLKSGGKLTVELNTTLGAISCELWPEEAPRTVLNFVELAEGTRQWKHPKTRQTVKEPLYDGTIFHRVIPKFMIQGGDPLGTGTGGPGYTFEDEVDQGLSFDRPGLLAMANSGPDTNGSQFFITDRSTPTHLTGKHTIFGICENLDIVEAIATAETARRDRPVEDVVVERVRIVRE